MTSKFCPGAGASRFSLDRPRSAGVAALLVLLTALAASFLAPGPAQARAAVELRVEVSDTEVAPGGRTLVWLRTYATQASSVQARSVAFRLSPELVAAGVTVGIDDANPNCTGDDSFISCGFEDTYFDFTPAGKRSTYIVLSAGTSAPVGTGGTITATFTGYHGEKVAAVAKATVVEGVDLVAGTVATLSARPGGSFEVPLTVRNAGANAADGVGLTADRAAWGMLAGTRYRNCRYDADRLVSCSFDQKLQPGTAYRAALPYRLRSDTLAPVKLTADFTWRTAAQHDAYLAEERALGKPAGTAGTGPALALEPVAATAAKQADVDYRNNRSRAEISVTGRNGVDLVALGAEVSGEAGDVVPVTVGMRNDGPAALDSDQSAMAAKVRVTLPRGTEAATVPARCRQIVEGDPEWTKPAESGALVYLCRAGGQIAPGAAEKFRFGLRVTRVIADATGQVEVTAACGTCELDKSDNKATIVVNGSGGEGGGLPVTGAPVAAVVGGALVLLAAGAGGLLLARRRRTRFLA